MIKKLSHVTIYVTNQEAAYDFYVNKLGLKVHTDVTMENGFRWLTVCPPDQPDFELALMEPKAGMGMEEEVASLLRTLIAKGGLGGASTRTIVRQRMKN